MLKQSSLADEKLSLHLQVKRDEGASPQDATSQRRTRLMWTGFGFGVLMLIGCSACAILPFASNTSAQASHFAPTLAFAPALPGAFLPTRHARSVRDHAIHIRRAALPAVGQMHKASSSSPVVSRNAAPDDSNAADEVELVWGHEDDSNADDKVELVPLVPGHKDVSKKAEIVNTIALTRRARVKKFLGRIFGYGQEARTRWEAAPSARTRREQQEQEIQEEVERQRMETQRAFNSLLNYRLDEQTPKFPKGDMEDQRDDSDRRKQPKKVEKLPSSLKWYVKTETFVKSKSFAEIKPYLKEHKEWVALLRRDSKFPVTSGYRVDDDDKPGGGGLMLFAAHDYNSALKLVQKDPLVANGCVDWQLNRWIAQVGDIKIVDGGAYYDDTPVSKEQ